MKTVRATAHHAERDGDFDQSQILRSLAWRFVRHGAGVLGILLLMTCGIPAFMYGILWMVDPNVARQFYQETGATRAIFTFGVCFALPALILLECSQVRPLYVLPVSNRLLVSTQLVLGIVAVAAAHLLTCLFYRIAFGATVPAWGPLLVICPMVVVMAGLAALWFDFRRWCPFLIAGLVLSAEFWYVGRRMVHASAMDNPDGWLTPTITETAVVMAAAVIGYWLTLHGVARDRCGERGRWPDLDALLVSLAARISRRWRTPSQAAPYRSGVSAHFWYEWWEKGLTVPLLALGFGGLSMIGAYYSPQRWLNGLMNGIPGILGMCLFLTGLIVGLLNFGRTGAIKGHVITQYRATRPLSDGQLAYAVIKAGLASVLATGVVIAVYALFVVVWSALHPAPTALPLLPPPDWTTIFVLCTLAGWGLLGLTASIVMTGRTWVVMLPIVLFFSGFLGWPLLGRLPVSQTLRELLLESLIAGLLLLLVAGTIAAYVFALRRRLISVQTVWIGGILAAVTAAIAYALPFGNATEPLAATLVRVAALTPLVAAPLATAPLALSWNRHR